MPRVRVLQSSSSEKIKIVTSASGGNPAALAGGPVISGNNSVPTIVRIVQSSGVGPQGERGIRGITGATGPTGATGAGYTAASIDGLTLSFKVIPVGYTGDYSDLSTVSIGRVVGNTGAVGSIGIQDGETFGNTEELLFKSVTPGLTLTASQTGTSTLITLDAYDIAARVGSKTTNWTYYSGISLLLPSAGEIRHRTNTSQLLIHKQDSVGTIVRDPFLAVINDITDYGESQIRLSFGDEERIYRVDSGSYDGTIFTFHISAGNDQSSGNGKSVNVGGYVNPGQNEILGASNYYRFPDGSTAGTIVTSWNGQTGDVVFADYVSSLNGQTGDISGAVGPTGATGPIGQTGPTGAQGIQGIQGPTGAQGIQGIQGIQGQTGAQGIQGIQGPTGPQGATGADGIIGVDGVTGPTGPTGAKGETGDGLFDTIYASGTTLNHSLNFDNINTVSGYGRKFPVLLDDGSVTFDYIRAQDIFLDSEFVFGINSFSISGSSTVLIGTGNYSLSGRSFTATYQEPGSISVSEAEVKTNATSDSGFPVDLVSGSASLTSETIAYPASKNTSITFTLGATGNDSSYVTSTDTITFRNNNYYGVSSSASLTGGDLGSLTAFLDNNRAATVSVNAGSGEYIYYAYPSSYGDASFTVGGFAGGFSKLHGGATAHTNSAGFSETYFIYRSDNASLGSTTVVVS